MSKKKIISIKQLPKTNFVKRCFGCHYEIKDCEHYVIPQVVKKWPDIDQSLYDLKKIGYVFHADCFIQLMEDSRY